MPQRPAAHITWRRSLRAILGRMLLKTACSHSLLCPVYLSIPWGVHPPYVTCIHIPPQTPPSTSDLYTLLLRLLFWESDLLRQETKLETDRLLTPQSSSRACHSFLREKSVRPRDGSHGTKDVQVPTPQTLRPSVLFSCRLSPSLMPAVSEDFGRAR